MENAFTANYKDHKIWDVKHGTGQNKFAMNVHTIFTINKVKDVFLLIIHVKESTKMEPAQLATKVITSTTELVC